MPGISVRLLRLRGALLYGRGRSQNKAVSATGSQLTMLPWSNLARPAPGLRMPHYLGLLAGMHRKAGKRAAGLKLVTEAAQVAERNHENWCNAMLELERGELLLLRRI